MLLLNIKSKLSFNFLSRFVTALFLITVSLILVSCGGASHSTTNPSTTLTTDPVATETVTHTKVVLYDGPSIMQSSSKIDMTVNDQDVFVYDTLVNTGRVFTYTVPDEKTQVAIFDFEGSVQVKIHVNDATVNSAVVRPLGNEIAATVADNTISFQLNYPGNYVVEYNGDSNTAINVFANPIETDTPDPNNIPSDMIYIGPGVYKADAIPVESNKTIYIAGGAVVYGQIRADSVDNVTIRGRGIIDGSIYPRTTAAEHTTPIELRYSNHVLIEGITFLNPAGWTITSYFNDGFTLDNIKIITARANGDGISIQSSKNVMVKNSFVRSWDDSLVVKNYDRGTTDHILFENNVLWTDLAQSMEIGYETNGTTMSNITFRNITVLHNFHKPVISIHNSDDAVISNVLYQNITVEDAQEVGDDISGAQDNFLFEFSIAYNQAWSSSGGTRGTIDGVTLDNVLIENGRNDLTSRLSGFDSTHKISNVTFHNVTYKGTNVKSAADLNMTLNNFSTNVDFNSSATATGANYVSPYVLNIPSSDVPEMTVVPNITQSGFLVPEFAQKEIPLVYNGQIVSGDFTASATHGNSILVWNDGSGAFETSSAANVLDGDRTTGWVGNTWSKTTGEFAALTIDFDSNKKIGQIRVYGDTDASIYTIQNIAVYGIRSTSTSDTYTKLLNSKDYEFSPATGNYADIKIAPGEFKSIQLRIYYKNGPAYPTQAFLNEVEFYPASLTFNQSVTATAYEDVYVDSNLTDGNPLTYYESEKGTWPVQVVIDMGATYPISYITMQLPPLIQWTTRVENVRILVSTDGTNFTEIVPATDYTFNPATGNIVQIQLDSPQSAQYIKFVFTSNSAAGGYGAQLSEISVFE